MKYIITTNKTPLHFNLNRERNLVIDTIVPIEVSEGELKILTSRLGRQIKVVKVMAEDEQTPTPEATPEATPETTPEQTPAPESTPESAPTPETTPESEGTPSTEATPETATANETAPEATPAA